MAYLDHDEIISAYRKRANRYDFTSNLYYLIGFRQWAYRNQAIRALNLKDGDTVVEIGCGTGLNFSLLEQAVGARGKIIGVDFTDEMLVQAEQRVKDNHWSNVELVRADAAKYEFPDGIDGIMATGVLTYVEQFDQVIKRGSKALIPGGRWVVLDMKLPSNWLRHFAPVLILLTRPFGTNIERAARKPWESMERYLEDVSKSELWLGFAYLAVGKSGDGLGRQK